MTKASALTTSLWALNAVNFFMADVTGGLGPFLGVYLQAQQWTPAEIGLAMTIGGLAGMAAAAPVGALVDRMKAKRALIAAGGLAVVAASMAILLVHGFVAIAATQVVSGIAGAAVGPAIAGMTLGLVRQTGFAKQNGRNQAFNHAGNVTAAALAGALGYWFGLGAAFAVLAAMAAGSMMSLTFIDPRRIDYRAARGQGEGARANVTGWSALATCKPLLVLAATLLLFHLGNAAMLPLLGQSLVAQGAGSPSAYTGATIFVAQVTMVPIALLAARLAENRGYWIVFLLALLALPLRGAIAAAVTGPIGLVPVQVLDGVGAGLLGVAVPGLVARILNGTGHVNAGLGAVMTLQGVGASLSPSLGGLVAGRLGYPAAFLTLGGVACAALLLWIVTRPVTAEACQGRAGATRRMRPASLSVSR